MPAGRKAAGPDKLSLVVYAGDVGRVHYALALAASARAIDKPATLFFTMGACRTLIRPAADGAVPWRALPDGEGGTAGQLDDRFAAGGLATFEDLLASCVALGARFLVCEMGLKAVGLAPSDLRDDVPLEVAGIVTFLADASPDGAMMFI
ncbi:MAG: DsrE family protein [Rhodospirillales bacterium]|nr:DsrE family protein [Rhodospirillales bacterium]